MKAKPARQWDAETILVAQCASVLSFFSFLYYLRQGDILLYGDAVAHINIARRIFDSQTPGLLQLGTVWLPLPHLLMVPFLLSRWMWHTGIGGSIPSLIAYVFSVVGIFRLVRGNTSHSSDAAGRGLAWTAAIVFAVNPNLIYLQTTAMTEPLYLAFFIWALVYFSEFLRGIRPPEQLPQPAFLSLRKSGLCVAAACLTRYDGWFLAAILWLVVLAAFSRRRNDIAFRRSFLGFTLIIAAVPVLWIAYNAAVYRNPLEFANGPYSAKAIEQRTSVPGNPPHPGTSDLPMAGSFFLKAAQLTVAPGNWGRFWLGLALLGSLIVLTIESSYAALLLLWIPLPFYVLSIAYGGVPIFLPVWWPHSIYNARYGLQLLPAFAVFALLGIYFLSRILPYHKYKTAVGLAFLILLGTSYAFIWRDRPIVFQEAWVNSRTRIALEERIAAFLSDVSPDSTFLMYLGDQVGAFERADVPLRRVIYDGNHRTWKQPFDPDGLWERALAEPKDYVDYVIALAGDPVALRVNQSQLTALEVIHVTGQPEAKIYATSKRR